ncbi:MAG: hypothetical protein M1816_001230 [Peltula sp. TS41687]|nr:MAG: hypothetical protein M1816_001230 [Peltula sp. TS41687]
MVLPTEEHRYHTPLPATQKTEKSTPIFQLDRPNQSALLATEHIQKAHHVQHRLATLWMRSPLAGKRESESYCAEWYIDGPHSSDLHRHERRLLVQALLVVGVLVGDEMKGKKEDRWEVVMRTLRAVQNSGRASGHGYFFRIVLLQVPGNQGELR